MADSEMDEALAEMDQGLRIALTSAGQIAEQLQLQQARRMRQQTAALNSDTAQAQQERAGIREAARAVYLAPGNATWWDTAEPADAVRAWKTAGIWAEQVPEARHAQAAIADAVNRRWGTTIDALEQAPRTPGGGRQAKVTAEDAVAVVDDAAAVRARTPGAEGDQRSPEESSKQDPVVEHEDAEVVLDGPRAPQTVQDLAEDEGVTVEEVQERQDVQRSDELAEAFRSAVGAGPAEHSGRPRPSNEVVDEARQERMAQALRSVWPADRAELVIKGEAFGAVAHHLEQMERAGRDPETVLQSVSSGEVTAGNIRHPAAFLAYRLEQVRTEPQAVSAETLAALPPAARDALEGSAPSFPRSVESTINTTAGPGPRVIKPAGVSVSQDFGR